MPTAGGGEGPRYRRVAITYRGLSREYWIIREMVLIICWSEKKKSGIGPAAKSLGIDVDAPWWLPIHDCVR